MRRRRSWTTDSEDIKAALVAGGADWPKTGPMGDKTLRAVIAEADLGASRYEFDTWVGTFSLAGGAFPVPGFKAGKLTLDAEDQVQFGLDANPAKVATLAGGRFVDYDPAATIDTNHGVFGVDTTRPRLVFSP